MTFSFLSQLLRRFGYKIKKMFFLYWSKTKIVVLGRQACIFICPFVINILKKSGMSSCQVHSKRRVYSRRFIRKRFCKQIDIIISVCFSLWIYESVCFLLIYNFSRSFKIN